MGDLRQHAREWDTITGQYEGIVHCANSGLPIPFCRGSICDCFAYGDDESLPQGHCGVETPHSGHVHGYGSPLLCEGT